MATVIMDGRNNARMIQTGPVSTDPALDDRLGSLPIELLDTIYCLVFSSENGPWTLHIKAKTYPSQHIHDPDADRYLPILALPRDQRYKIRRQQHPHERWTDNVEGAFMEGR